MTKINRFYFSLFLWLAVYFSGCQPYPRVEFQGPSHQDEKIPISEAKMIDDRIQHLEQTLLADDLGPNDRQVTEQFIDAYSQLKKLLILAYENQNNVLVINEVFQRISLIEKQYFAKNGIKDEKKEQRARETQPENNLSGLIQEANQLAQKQAFTEAKLLLIKARIKTDNDSDIKMIDQTLKNIELNQSRIEQGEEPANYVSEKEAQQQVAALIEEEKYEDAINILEKLERQQPLPDAETKRLKDLAAEKIINRDRNRAAQLYLQAKNTQDPTKKKVLLQSSLDILNNLVEKYPSSYLIERIKDHISIVEKALNEW